jgi:hypothetical protein
MYLLSGIIFNCFSIFLENILLILQLIYISLIYNIL